MIFLKSIYLKNNFCSFLYTSFVLEQKKNCEIYMNLPFKSSKLTGSCGWRYAWHNIPC